MFESDVFKIVEATSELIISKKIASIYSESDKINGFYGILCFNLNGIYNYNEASRLRQAYRRNNWNFRNLVETYNKSKINSKIQRVEHFSYSNLEWSKFLERDLSKKLSRKEFLKGFHDQLAFKLQERGKIIVFIHLD